MMGTPSKVKTCCQPDALMNGAMMMATAIATVAKLYI